MLSKRTGLFESQAARICSTNENTAEVCKGAPIGSRCNEPGKYCSKIGSGKGDYPNCECNTLNK